MSVTLLQLWLPILAGTILAWIVSGLIHMVVKYHNSDYQQLDNEAAVLDALRAGTQKLGLHQFPFCGDMKNMQDENVKAKFTRGPVGLLVIVPNGMPPMGKLMAQQISHFLFGSILIAYCATQALEPGADYMSVFRFVASVGFLAFGWASIPYSIWFGFQWSMTARYLLDALIYGLVVAGAFAWLWP